MVILKYHLKKQTFLDRLSIKYKNPLSLYIECVNVCNAACIFCYYPKISDTINKQTMSVEDFSSYIDQFSSVGGSNIGLTPTLGDPLVDKYFNDRLRIIDKSTISNLVFYTNLINLKSSHIDSLVAVKNTKIRIFVSITGFSKEEYAKFMGIDNFDKVKKNLQLLANINNSNVRTTVILRKYNGCDFDLNNFSNYINSLNFKISIMDEFDTWGGLVDIGSENKTKFKLKLKSRATTYGPCNKSYTKSVITVDGQYKLCDVRDVKNELAIGSVKEKGLLKLWNSDTALSFRKTFKINGKVPDICRKCEYYVSIYSLKEKDTK